MTKKNNIVLYIYNAAIRFERGMRAYYLGDLDQAIQYIQEACLLDRKNEEYQVHLAVLLTENKNWTDAIDMLEWLLNRNVQVDTCQLLLTICYSNMGQEDLAKIYADKFVCTTARHEVQALLKSKNFSKDEVMREFLLLALESVELNTFEGITRAIVFMKRMIEIDDTNFAVYNPLAHAYICIKDYAAAEKYLFRLLDKQPENIQGLCNLIYLYQSCGQKEKMEEIIKKVEKMVPIDEADRLKLGCTLASAEKFERAFLCLKNIHRPEYRMRKSYSYWMERCSAHLKIILSDVECTFP